MWYQVGGRVGRLGIACRDRWRIICLGSKLKSGVWDLYEDQKLIDLVETYMDGKEQVLPPPHLSCIHTPSYVHTVLHVVRFIRGGCGLQHQM